MILNFTLEQTYYLNKIISQGGAPYIVGGFIRDSMLGTKSYDLDIEVFNLEYEKLLDVFSTEKIIEYNFKVLSIPKLNFEITIPRTETKVGNSHQDFKIIHNINLSIPKASIRRDFTINSLYYDYIKKKIIDPYNGKLDLKNKTIKHISSKFLEDPLRILRALRFSFTLGFEIDFTTLNLCKNNLNLINFLSPHLINKELSNMFSTPYHNIGLLYLEDLFSNNYNMKIDIDFFKKLNKMNLDKKTFFRLHLILFNDILALDKILVSKKEIRLISNIISDISTFSSNILFMFDKYKLNSSLLILAHNIINPTKEIQLSIFDEYIKLKKVYNGIYFLNKGFSGPSIKIEQKKIIEKFLFKEK